MDGDIHTIDQADEAMLLQLIMDAFHRIIVHYGQWYAQVEHQLGMEKALEIETDVWSASLRNQLNRVGKTIGFSAEEGVPEPLTALPRKTLLTLLKNLSVNWLANDGIWFQGVETRYTIADAKRCNDTCWSRFSPFEAKRIKTLLNLPESGGIPALKKALGFRLYALVNEQSIEDVDQHTIIFYMNNCRVQAARRRKGLTDYPCKSGGMVEYRSFAEAIDSRLQTECIGCPPDPHPEAWFCAWKFSMNGA